MKRIVKTLAIMMCCIMMFTGCGLLNQESNEAKRGKWDGETFTSEFADLKLQLPDGWVSATDEEIASIMGVTVEALNNNGNQLSEELLKQQSIYDAVVQNKTTGNNIIIMLENLKMSVGGTKCTEEEYMDAVKEQIKQSSGDGYKFGEVYEEKVGTYTYKVFKAEITDTEQVQYFYARRVEDYMNSIVVTICDDEKIEDIMKNFL